MATQKHRFRLPPWQVLLGEHGFSISDGLHKLALSAAQSYSTSSKFGWSRTYCVRLDVLAKERYGNGHLPFSWWMARISQLQATTLSVAEATVAQTLPRPKCARRSKRVTWSHLLMEDATAIGTSSWGQWPA